MAFTTVRGRGRKGGRRRCPLMGALNKEGTGSIIETLLFYTTLQVHGGDSGQLNIIIW